MGVLTSGQPGPSPHAHVSSQQQQSLDETFLKDAVMDRLRDDVAEVVAAALRVLEVSVGQSGGVDWFESGV